MYYDLDFDDIGYISPDELGIDPETDEERQNREDWEGNYSIWLDSYRL